MSKGKQMVPVFDLLEEVNRRNRVSTCAPGVREGWNSLLCHALHATNNYCGFMYLTADKVPAGHPPGIIRGENGADNTFPDESRVMYYYSSTMQKIAAERRRKADPVS